MKFKIQQYQTDAVEAVAGVFVSQPERNFGVRPHGSIEKWAFRGVWPQDVYCNYK